MDAHFAYLQKTYFAGGFKKFGQAWVKNFEPKGNYVEK